MKETVKLQQTLAQCDKDLQVLTSKLESAKSNLAFLNKRQEELRDHGADLRAATAGEGLLRERLFSNCSTRRVSAFSGS